MPEKKKKPGLFSAIRDKLMPQPTAPSMSAYDPIRSLNDVRGRTSIYSAPMTPGAAPAEKVWLTNITDEKVKEIDVIRQKYKDWKQPIDTRIIENEELFRLQQWNQMTQSTNPGDPRPASSWLHNVVLNKHAAMMDSYPELVVLPREEGDDREAKMLSAIMPAIDEQCNYEQVYSDKAWDKCKFGGSITGVFWDNTKLNGLGDIDIRRIDLLNFFWEPGVRDIQRSRNIFHVELIDRDIIAEAFPDVADKLAGSEMGEVTKYIHDLNYDIADKVAVVDWYYKVRRGGKTILHYCKYCQGVVLYASENDPELVDAGWYDDGQYPFVIDSLFTDPLAPFGIGYIEQNKDAQKYVDKLDQAFLKHAIAASKVRVIVTEQSRLNEEELLDFNKDVIHAAGAGSLSDTVMPLTVPDLPSIYVQMRENKIGELKETAGNRDFNQGGTTAGVTAASAIAALQEAGSKLDRDSNKGSYRAERQIGMMKIARMRQFYTEPRYFRIIGEKQTAEYVSYTNAGLQPQFMGRDFGTADGYRVPTFDISVKAQKASPFSTVAENERAKELYAAGFFRPDMADQADAALEMMTFEGKEKVREHVRNNGLMYQSLQQLSQLSIFMAAELDNLTGGVNQYAAKVAQVANMQLSGQQQTPAIGTGRTMPEPTTNALGEVSRRMAASTAGAARQRAAQNSVPR